MNFLNPYIEIYLHDPNENQHEIMPFYREVVWLFSKNLDNGLKMFQHRVNIDIKGSREKIVNLKFGSIYTHHTGINIKESKQLNEHSKRKAILELVHSAFISLANQFNWDKEVINHAYQESINENFQFVYYTDFKVSRNGKFKGRIRINLKERLTTFTSELCEVGSSDFHLVKLLETEQGNFGWWKSIRDFGWMDPDNFGLKLMQGEIWIVDNTNSLEVREVFKPSKNSPSRLDNFLLRLKEPIIPFNSKNQAD